MQLQKPIVCNDSKRKIPIIVFESLNTSCIQYKRIPEIKVHRYSEIRNIIHRLSRKIVDYMAWCKKNPKGYFILALPHYALSR